MIEYVKGDDLLDNKDFEQTFSDFLDRHEYDTAQAALFEIVRVAYTAGWLAGGGASLESEKALDLSVKQKLETTK